MRFVRILPVLIALAGVGCSSQPAPVAVQQTTTPAADKAKAVLQDVANSGELGSGLEELKMALEELKQSDAAKAEELLQDLQKLESSGGGDAAKSQAEQMLGKL